jgi:hypothetical protein
MFIKKQEKAKLQIPGRVAFLSDLVALLRHLRRF